MSTEEKPHHEITRICTSCGDEFTIQYRFGRPPGFCSPECKRAGRQDRKRICKVCKNVFELPRWGSHSTAHAQFCSEACASAPKCRHCYIQFNPHGSEGRLPHFFCSEDCQAAHCPATANCVRCQSPLSLPQLPAALRGYARFCGQICREAWASENGRMRTQGDRHWMNYWERLGTEHQVYECPLTPGGKPYFVMARPEAPIDRHCQRNRVAYDIWQAVIQKMRIELTPDQAVAYFVTHGHLSLHPAKTTTQQAGSPSMWELLPWLLPDLIQTFGAEWVQRLAVLMHNAETTHGAVTTAAKRLMKMGNTIQLTLDRPVATRTLKQVNFLAKMFTVENGITQFGALVDDWEHAVFMRNPLQGAGVATLEDLTGKIPPTMYSYGSARDTSELSQYDMGLIHMWAVQKWMLADRPYPSAKDIGIVQYEISTDADRELPTYFQRFKAMVWNPGSLYLEGYEPDPVQQYHEQTPGHKAQRSQRPRLLPKDYKF